MLSPRTCETPSDTLHFRCLTLPDSASVTCQLLILSLSEQPPAKPLAILHTFSIPEFCVSPQKYTFAPSAWHICVQPLGEHFNLLLRIHILSLLLNLLLRIHILSLLLNLLLRI